MGAKDSWGLQQGDEITPDLSVVKLLGGGSSYEAYLAFDEVTYGPVVVKVLRPSQVDDASSLRGLRREVQALATVNHPVVVRGLRHDLDGDRPHVVLEQIDGPRLSSLIRRHGPLPEQQYLPLAIELAGALHYLRGLAGPISTSSRATSSWVPPYGSSTCRGPTVDDAAALTTEIGTDAYMAPEQCPRVPQAFRDPPATSGASGATSSTPSPVTGPSTRGTRRQRTARGATPSWSTRRTSCRTVRRTRSSRSCSPLSSPTRPTGRSRTSWPRHSSRSWPASPRPASPGSAPADHALAGRMQNSLPDGSR